MMKTASATQRSHKGPLPIDWAYMQATTIGTAAIRADSSAKAKASREIPSLAPGDRVTHDSFGLGTVVSLEGAGDKAVASIDFGSGGVKRLLLRYAPVEKL